MCTGRARKIKHATPNTNARWQCCIKRNAELLKAAVLSSFLPASLLKISLGKYTEAAAALLH